MNYEEFLRQIIARDDRYIILTAENRAAIRNLPQNIGNKFIDTGITEQALIGIASGMAVRGRIPLAHALATFLTLRAFEFIRSDIGIENLSVKLIGSAAGFLSEANGPTHQAIEDISLMRGIPPVNIFCPADEEDMMIGLGKVFESPSPFYVRFNSQPSSVRHAPDFEIGKAEVISEGRDVTILVYGMLLAQAVDAKNILSKEGITVRVVNMRTVKPIDVNEILRAARETELIVTLEDHFITGGLFSIVSEILINEKTRPYILPIAFNNKWFKPLLLKDAIEYEGFSGLQIAKKIEQRLDLFCNTSHAWFG